MAKTKYKYDDCTFCGGRVTERRVNLNVRGAQANQLFDLVTQDLNYVGEEAVERRISSLRVFSGPKVGPQSRARKRYFGNSVGFAVEIGKLVG